MNALSKLRDEAYICRRQCSKDLLTEEAMYIHHLLSSCKAWAGLRLCPKLMIYPLGLRAGQDRFYFLSVQSRPAEPLMSY